MGIADMLNQLAISYDSDEAIDCIEQVMEFITNAAYQASAMIAKEKKPFSFYRKLIPTPKVAVGYSARV